MPLANDYAALNTTALNTTLAKLLDQFDLNQPMGGCSLTIFHQGHRVTQLSHGVARVEQGEPIAWQADTLALNFSTGKGVLVTLIHVLVSQGLLDYDTPIASYWSDFAQNNKQAITLRQVLSHEARLFDITSITDDATDMLDWQSMLTKVAAMPISTVYPSNQTGEPITSSNTVASNTVASNAVASKIVAYSALVSGWVLGGLIEMVTQQPLQQALEHFLLQPLGIVGQVYIGVPSDKVTQVAGQMREKTTHTKPVLVEDKPTTLAFYQSLPFYKDWQTHTDQSLNTQTINQLYFEPKRLNMQTYKASLVPAGSRQFNYYDPASLQAKMPAVNCVASSNALAVIYAMLANGGQWQGKTIIQAAVFRQLSTLQNQQFDSVMPAQMDWRLGYHRVFSLFHDAANAFGHLGYNGSMAWCDPQRKLAVAFVHNYDVTMLNDIRQFILNETILDFFDH